MRRWAWVGALLAAGCEGEPAYAPEDYVDEQGLGFYTSFSGPRTGGFNLLLRPDGVVAGWDASCSDARRVSSARWARDGDEIVVLPSADPPVFERLRLDPATRTATSLHVDGDGLTVERTWTAGVTCGRGPCGWGESGEAGFDDTCAPEIPESVAERLPSP